MYYWEVLKGNNFQKQQNMTISIVWGEKNRNRGKKWHIIHYNSNCKSKAEFWQSISRRKSILSMKESHVNDSLKYWIEFMLFALGTQQQIFSSIWEVLRRHKENVKKTSIFTRATRTGFLTSSLHNDVTTFLSPNSWTIFEKNYPLTSFSSSCKLYQFSLFEKSILFIYYCNITSKHFSPTALRQKRRTNNNKQGQAGVHRSPGKPAVTRQTQCQARKSSWKGQDQQRARQQSSCKDLNWSPVPGLSGGLRGSFIAVSPDLPDFTTVWPNVMQLYHSRNSIEHW